MNTQLKQQLLRIAEENNHTDDPTHDFYHVLRVLKNVELIASKEGGDLDILIPAALFHDVINHPKNSPKARQAPDESAEWTTKLLSSIKKYPAEKIPAVHDAISKCSFGKGIVPRLLESKILQDADGLESTGAISIMRTFASCGTLKRPFYHPHDPFYQIDRHNTSGFSPYGVDLFYERLLLVEGRMHTPTAKNIAMRRTAFLRDFLEELKLELNETQLI